MSTLRRFAGYRPNVLAALIVLGFAWVAVAAPRIAPGGPFDRAPAGQTINVPVPPSREHPFGLAPHGVDVFRLVVWGTRDAFRFGLIITLATGSLGVLVGALSGYAGGWINTVLMRLTDAFLAFPAIASIWLFTQVMFSFNPEVPLTTIQQLSAALQVSPIMPALILFSWMPYARLINTNVSRLKHLDFVQAAQALGAGHIRIVVRHLLPNAIGPVVVLAARDVGSMVILGATFTFIGLGGASMWGGLLLAGRSFILGVGGNPLIYWWTFLPPTLTIVLFSLGWNLLGDGLNRLLDPRASRRH